MPEINKALGSAGAGHKVVIGGKEYTFMPLTKGMQAEFEDWMVKRVRDAAMKTGSELRKRARQLRLEAKKIQDDSEDDKWSQEEVQVLTEKFDELLTDAVALEKEALERLRQVDDAVAMGSYDFRGNICMKSLHSPSGSVKMVGLMLRKHHPTITTEEIVMLHEEHLDDLHRAAAETMEIEKKATQRSKKKLLQEETKESPQE